MYCNSNHYFSCPPVERADPSDARFRYIQQGCLQELIAAYGCGDRFDDSCLSLLTALLSTDPGERIAMEDVKTHPWIRDVMVQMGELQENETCNLKVNACSSPHRNKATPICISPVDNCYNNTGNQIKCVTRSRRKVLPRSSSAQPVMLTVCDVNTKQCFAVQVVPDGNGLSIAQLEKSAKKAGCCAGHGNTKNTSSAGSVREDAMTFVFNGRAVAEGFELKKLHRKTVFLVVRSFSSTSAQEGG